MESFKNFFFLAPLQPCPEHLHSELADLMKDCVTAADPERTGVVSQEGEGQATKDPARQQCQWSGWGRQRGLFKSSNRMGGSESSTLR